MLNNPIFVRTLAKQFALIALSGIILVSNSALATGNMAFRDVSSAAANVL